MAGQINIAGNNASVNLQGNDTITTDQIFTFPATGGTLLVSDSNIGLWERTDTTIRPADAGDSVSIGGTSAAPNITLNADGSAQYVGIVEVLSLLTTPNGQGIQGYRSTTTDNVWQGGLSATQVTSQLAANGDLRLGGPPGGNAPNITLGADGTSSFSEEVSVGVRDSQGVFITDASAVEAWDSGTRIWQFYEGDLYMGGNLENTPKEPNITLDAPNGRVSSVGSHKTGSTSAGGGGGNYMATGEFAAYSPQTDGAMFRGWYSGGSTNVLKAHIVANGKLMLGGTLTGSASGNDPNVQFEGANGNGLMVGTLTQNASDIKFKDNIADAPSQAADIKALQLRTWDWNDIAPGSETRKARHTMGLVAQEAALVDADITYTANEGAEDVNDEFQAIDHDVLTMKLVGALQEALTRIETLEAEVAALKSA